MKIITTHHPEDPVFSGIIASFASIEPNTMIWLPQYKPVFDMFDEMHPDLFICTIQDLTPVVLSALREYRVKTILFGMQCPVKFTPDLLCVGDVSDDIIENIDAPTMKIKNAANVAQYTRGIFEDKYYSDVLYLSNTNINSYPDILPIIESVISKEWKVKICGDQPLPFPQYLGKINVKNATNLMVSTKIILDFNQNILLDAAFNKVFCLSNIQNDFYPSYTSIEDLKDKVTHFLDDQKHRDIYIKKAHKHAKDNTYYHRIWNICNQLNLTELLEPCERKLEAIKC